MTREHLSRGDVGASASTTAAAAGPSSSRRMLPIVPGTSALAVNPGSPAPGLLAGPGPGSGGGAAAAAMSGADSALGRHTLSMVSFPLTQRSSEL